MSKIMHWILNSAACIVGNTRPVSAKALPRYALRQHQSRQRNQSGRIMSLDVALVDAIYAAIERQISNGRFRSLYLGMVRRQAHCRYPATTPLRLEKTLNYVNSA
jgi:hypothetical protein